MCLCNSMWRSERRTSDGKTNDFLFNTIDGFVFKDLHKSESHIHVRLWILSNAMLVSKERWTLYSSWSFGRFDRLFWSLSKWVEWIVFLLKFDLIDRLALGVCTDFELEVFPKRMTTWLGEILDALVRRKKSFHLKKKKSLFFCFDLVRS